MDLNVAVCPDRLALGQEMVEATALVYAAKREYDHVRTSQPASHGDLLRLVDALTNARARAREAAHRFEDHVKEHQCKA